MKKVSTAAVKTRKNCSQPKLTIGLDLGDRNSWYCVLDESGRKNVELTVTKCGQLRKNEVRVGYGSDNPRTK